MSNTLLLAEWIAPMDALLLRRAALVFDQGRILALGDRSTLRLDHPDAQVIDLGGSLILPGLINAHTHLELSDQSLIDVPGSGFVGWIREIRARSRAPRTNDQIAAATAIGIDQSLRYGCTTVGDISRECAVTRAVLAASPLRSVSFGEITALGKLRAQAESLMQRAAESSAAGARLHPGVSPHSPYTVEAQFFRDCLQLARSLHLPLATHLAESPDESIFLSDHAGPFRELWASIDLWSEPPTRFAGGPIRYARALGLLDYQRTLLAHVNYADDAELDILAEGVASVVFCPRTHAHFAHPPHRWRDMLIRGINVCVGTDSCASSADLNVVEELRLLHRQAPLIEPGHLWALATTRAARALGLDDEVGSLTPGKSADLLVYPTAGESPLVEILESSATPTQVWSSGCRLR